MKKLILITPIKDSVTKFSLGLYPLSVVKDRITIVDLWKFTTHDNGERIDDYGFGGGGGMVLRLPPLVSAIEFVKNSLLNQEPSFVILLTPGGRILTQNLVHSLTVDSRHLIFISGAYEGIDARIENFVDCEISIGDYVVSNGDVAGLVLLNSVVRYFVLEEKAIQNESFSSKSSFPGYIDYDVFTRPRIFRDKYKVPELLLSGNHAEIYKWRCRSSIFNSSMVSENNFLSKKFGTSVDDLRYSHKKKLFWKKILD